MSDVLMPENWLSLSIDEISDDVTYGYTASSTSKNTGCKLLRITDIQDDSVNWSEVPFCEISENDLKKYTLENGDLVFARTGATVGKSYLIRNLKEVSVYASYLIRIRFNSILNPSYFSYFFKSIDYWNQISSSSAGIGQPNVNGTKLKQLNVPIAPLAEQQEIVRQFDIMLVQVEQIKARLDAIPAILKKFRQSVLADAVSGKLTTELELKEVLIPNDRGDIKFYINPDWKLSQLKDVADVISGHAFKSSSFTKNGVLAVKISNIQYGYFEIKNQEYLPKEFLSEYDRFVVKNNDLLMALTRPITNNTLKVCRYPKDLESGLLNQRVCKIESNEKIFKDFLELVFQTDYFKQQVEGNLSETLQPNLSPTDLKKFYLGVPHIDEQIQIINIVKNLFAYADKIAETVQSPQKRVNLLTQSILAKAFSGELTAEWRQQHQELITGINSAESLLAKIQAEREASKPVKKTRKKKEV